MFDASGPATLKTSNGSVSFSGLLTGDHNQLNSSNGNLHLSIPADAAAIVDASTSNGRINCKLPRVSVTSESKTALKGQVGGAGESTVAVRLRTSNGSVTIDAAR